MIYHKFCLTLFCNNNNNNIIDNEVTEHELDISLDGWQWQSKKETQRQLWQYKRLYIEYCYMALEGQSFLCLELMRTLGLHTCKGPCPPALWYSLDPTTTQLSQKAQPEHLVWGRGSSDNRKADFPWHNKSFASFFWLPVYRYRHHSSSLSVSFVLSFIVSLFYLPFLLLASVSGAMPVAVTSPWWWEHLS